MRRCVGVTAFRQQFPKKSINGTCAVAIASTSSPSGRSILAHRPGEVQRNGPPHYGAWGAMGESQMNSKLTKLAAAGVLSLCTAAPALAGSVTQPGETVGLNTGAPLPQGWYVNQYGGLGLQEHKSAAHVYGSHHSGRCLVNAVDDFGRETTVPGGVACGGSRRATKSKPEPRPQFARHLF